MRYMDFDTTTSMNAYVKQNSAKALIIVCVETVQTAGRSIFRVWFKE